MTVVKKMRDYSRDPVFRKKAEKTESISSKARVASTIQKEVVPDSTESQCKIAHTGVEMGMRQVMNTWNLSRQIREI